VPVSIPLRERDAAIQALRAGVVPRLGIRHIQVGRAREVEEAVRDITRITEGGSACRFVIGEYGAGKSFYLNLARTVAAERKLVVMHADLSPDRRIHASGGQARALYSELVRSMATRTKPDGGALASILERLIGDVRTQALASGRDVAAALQSKLDPLREEMSGHDYADIVGRYWRASEDGDEMRKAAALRWLRGEFTLKTEARELLGVRTIIEDAGLLDHLKALGQLVRLAGYEGTLVVMDEMVNLYKMVNAQGRNANYEQILRILNDVLQGSASRIGFYFGGTPEFLLDTRRGLYSYEALRSRLAENTFARGGLIDLSGPVIRLGSLGPEELFVLLEKLRLLWAGGDQTKLTIPDEALHAFLEHCRKQIGEAYFRTPRNTIREFLGMLAILEQNPGTDWRSLVAAVEIQPDAPQTPAVEATEEVNSLGAPTTSAPTQATRPHASEDDEDLPSFRL
jgi:hypothetical protein